MEAVERDEEYDILNPRTGLPCGSLNSRKVFSRIVKQAWKNGEPGIIFLDRLNKDNPTPHIGVIESTNPCGEQPLLPTSRATSDPSTWGKWSKNGEVNWARLREVIQVRSPFPRQRH